MTTTLYQHVDPPTLLHIIRLHQSETRIPPHKSPVRILPKECPVGIPPHESPVRILPHKCSVRIPPHKCPVRIPPHKCPVRILPHKCPIRFFPEIAYDKYVGIANLALCGHARLCESAIGSQENQSQRCQKNHHGHGRAF